MDLPLQPYDALMILVLVGTTVFGAWKGMAWQLASLASLVLSAAVAVHCSGPLAPLLSEHEPWNRFLAMLLLYLATSLAIWVSFRLVAGIIDRVRLREFDRQVGALFGLAKGLLLCVVITFFAVTLSEPLRLAVLKTYSGKYVATLSREAGPVLPEEVRNVIGGYVDKLDEKLTPDGPSNPVATGLDTLATPPLGSDSWPSSTGLSPASPSTGSETTPFHFESEALERLRQGSQRLRERLKGANRELQDFGQKSDEILEGENLGGLLPEETRDTLNGALDGSEEHLDDLGRRLDDFHNQLR